jgi:hypothetical protein
MTLNGDLASFKKLRKPVFWDLKGVERGIKISVSAIVWRESRQNFG